jgi:hypothetical protein
MRAAVSRPQAPILWPQAVVPASLHRAAARCAPPPVTLPPVLRRRRIPPGKTLTGEGAAEKQFNISILPFQHFVILVSTFCLHNFNIWTSNAEHV